MITLVKLGGSLITNKLAERQFRQSIMDRLASEIASACEINHDLKLIIGHGSGSFGHFAASRYRTIDGVHSLQEWRAFAEVATVAAELNYLVAKSLHEAGVPVWRLQPSSSSICNDGELVLMSVDPIRRALNNGLVPLVYGDVSFDNVRGGTILSTERIFLYLTAQLAVSRIFLLGEVEGVYDSRGAIIHEINNNNFAEIESALGRSLGVDTTGGMNTKVRDMMELVSRLPAIEVRIFDGRQPSLLEKALLGVSSPGTVIRKVS
jgi:isopentenyl phosphate kinase